MLKIKDIISMLKDLYKSNLILENFFDVLLTIGAFSLCCNFLSKFGLTFVLLSGVLYLLDVATGIVFLTLFAPSIFVLANLPIAYIKNITKDIKQYKNDNKNLDKNQEDIYISYLNETKEMKNISKKQYSCNDKESLNKKMNMVRVRKK